MSKFNSSLCVLLLMVCPAFAVPQQLISFGEVYTNFHGDGPANVEMEDIAPIWAFPPWPSDGPTNNADYGRWGYQHLWDCVMSVADRVDAIEYVFTYYPPSPLAHPKYTDAGSDWVSLWNFSVSALGDCKSRNGGRGEYGDSWPRRMNRFWLTVIKGVEYHVLIPIYINYAKADIHGSFTSYFATNSTLPYFTIEEFYAVTGTPTNYFDEVKDITNVDAYFASYTSSTSRRLNDSDVMGWYQQKNILRALKWTGEEGAWQSCTRATNVSDQIEFDYTNGTYSALGLNAALDTITPPNLLPGMFWWEDCPWSDSEGKFFDAFSNSTFTNMDCEAGSEPPALAVAIHKPQGLSYVSYTLDNNECIVQDRSTARDWDVQGSLTRPNPTFYITNTVSTLLARYINDNPGNWAAHMAVTVPYLNMGAQWVELDSIDILTSSCPGPFATNCGGSYSLPLISVDLRDSVDTNASYDLSDCDPAAGLPMGCMFTVTNCEYVVDCISWEVCLTNTVIWYVQCTTNIEEYCSWYETNVVCYTLYSNVYDVAGTTNCYNDAVRGAWYGLTWETNGFMTNYLSNCVESCALSCDTNCEFWVSAADGGYWYSGVHNHHPAAYGEWTLVPTNVPGWMGESWTILDRAVDTQIVYAVENALLIFKWDQSTSKGCVEIAPSGPICDTSAPVVGWGFPDLVGDCWNLLQ